MMCKNEFPVLIYYSEQYDCILGDVAQWKVVSACEEALNQDKKSQGIFHKISLEISLSIKRRVKRFLLTKISKEGKKFSVNISLGAIFTIIFGVSTPGYKYQLQV